MTNLPAGRSPDTSPSDAGRPLLDLHALVILLLGILAGRLAYGSGGGWAAAIPTGVAVVIVLRALLNA